MKIYEFGLQNHSDRPQVYKLSAILAGYFLGYRKQGFELTSVSCKDMDVKSDGSMDFSVPKRYSEWPRDMEGAYMYGSNSWPQEVWRRAKLAWEVIAGRASILYYE